MNSQNLRPDQLGQLLKAYATPTPVPHTDSPGQFPRSERCNPSYPSAHQQARAQAPATAHAHVDIASEAVVHGRRPLAETQLASRNQPHAAAMTHVVAEAAEEARLPPIMWEVAVGGDDGVTPTDLSLAQPIPGVTSALCAAGSTSTIGPIGMQGRANRGSRGDEVDGSDTSSSLARSVGSWLAAHVAACMIASGHAGGSQQPEYLPHCSRRVLPELSPSHEGRDAQKSHVDRPHGSQSIDSKELQQSGITAQVAACMIALGPADHSTMAAGGSQQPQQQPQCTDQQPLEQPGALKKLPQQVPRQKLQNVSAMIMQQQQPQELSSKNSMPDVPTGTLVANACELQQDGQGQETGQEHSELVAREDAPDEEAEGDCPEVADIIDQVSMSPCIQKRAMHQLL